MWQITVSGGFPKKIQPLWRNFTDAPGRLPGKKIFKKWQNTKLREKNNKKWQDLLKSADEWVIIQHVKRKFLQGRVIRERILKFPTGGIVRDPLKAADLVRFQDRQYSLDERRTHRYV